MKGQSILHQLKTKFNLDLSLNFQNQRMKTTQIKLMKKLKENILSFNLIKQKLRDMNLHFLFRILLQPKPKIQEAHKLVELFLGGITLTNPN